MANTRALEAFWVKELSELRKTTAELTQFLALLTPVGASCADLSIKGELGWQYLFHFFGNDANDPELDKFADYVLPRIQEAMTEYPNLSAKDVVNVWVDQMHGQTWFISTCYWAAAHRIYEGDDNNILSFKRSSVRPATFAECFPRIDAHESVLRKEEPLYNPESPRGPQTPPCISPRALLVFEGYA